MTRLDALTGTVTTAAAPTGRPLRSLGAVLAGLAATFAVTTATDVALHALRVFPPFAERMSDALFVVALAYRILFNVAGSALTARVAPARRMRHALALGAVGVVLASIGAIAFGKLGPTWYALANIAVALPCAWVGGRLASRGAERADFTLGA